MLHTERCAHLEVGEGDACGVAASAQRDGPAAADGQVVLRLRVVARGPAEGGLRGQGSHQTDVLIRRGFLEESSAADSSRAPRASRMPASKEAISEGSGGVVRAECGAGGGGGQHACAALLDAAEEAHPATWRGARRNEAGVGAIWSQ